MSSSMTQQHRICIDLLNTGVGPQIDTNAWFTWFIPCSPGTWITWCHVPREHDAALTQPGNIVYCCTSRDVRWTNHDHTIQILIQQRWMFLFLQHQDLLQWHRGLTAKINRPVSGKRTKNADKSWQQSDFNHLATNISVEAQIQQQAQSNV